MDTRQRSPAAGGITADPPCRVLCVDDNRVVADSLTMLLGLAGFEARACYDGPAALREAEGFRPGVCIIDLNMPGMDGDEVAAHLLASPRQRPGLVALTAMSDEASRVRTAAAGFDRHLVKPVDPRLLIALAWSLCARAGSVEETP